MWRLFILLTVALIGLFFLNLSLGSVTIPLDAFVQFMVSGDTGKDNWNLILREFRLPKAITALLAGSALSLSGLQMQTLFRNPLAGPFVIGISSGAGLGVALVIFTSLHWGIFQGISSLGRNWLIVGASGVGSFLVLLTVILTLDRLKDTVSLLIIGLMFGTLASSVVSMLQFFSEAENIQAYVIWSFGNLGGVSNEELTVMAPLVITGLIGAFFLSKNLNALLLSDDAAQSIGLNLKRSRLLIVLNTSLMAGAVTAFCGPIGFIGLAVPHLVRMVFQTSNHLLLTPLIILLGGCLMLAFDMIAQLPGMAISLPLNAVTSFFGAPFIIYLLLRRRTAHYSYR